MITANNSYIPERCSKCPMPPGYVQKEVQTKKFGDWVHLSLSIVSQNDVTKFTNDIAVRTLQANCSSLDPNSLTASEPSRLHLTLATPLAHMDMRSVKALMDEIDVSFGEINHEINFNHFRFDASSPNFADGFNVGIENNQEIARIAHKVRSFCEARNLVNIVQNPDRQLNSFNPHISLGKINGKTNCVKLHERRQHNRATNLEDLHILIAKAAKANHLNSIKLVFDKIEISRIDNQNDETRVHLLASKDLKSKTLRIIDGHFGDAQGVNRNQLVDPSDAMNSLVSGVSSLAISKPSTPPQIEVKLTKEAAAKKLETLLKGEFFINHQVFIDNNGQEHIQLTTENEDSVRRLKQFFITHGQPESTYCFDKVPDGSRTRWKKVFKFSLGESRLNTIFPGEAKKLLGAFKQ